MLGNIIYWYCFLYLVKIVAQ